MKVLRVKVTVVLKTDDGGEQTVDVLDWADDGPGQSLDVSCLSHRPMRHMYELGASMPFGVEVDGPTHFQMKCTKHGPPRIIGG